MKSSTTRKAKAEQANGDHVVPDWVLENYDAATTEKPNVENEFRRLQALKTFALLDQPTEECYQRFTSLAARLFRTPMAQLSLVDLGRTYFVAQTGFPTARTTTTTNTTISASTAGTAASDNGAIREVPRKTSFCAHGILCTKSVLVVPDAAADPRFQNNCLVREHGVRFYAGAPLVTPDGGFRLGCLSILDTKPRPEGLSDDDCQALVNMAASVMDLMLEKRLGVGQAGLSFSYDVQRAATQLRESLHQLKDDSSFQTVASESHRSLVQSACTTADHLLDSVVVTDGKKDKNISVGDNGRNAATTILSTTTTGDDPMDYQNESSNSAATIATNYHSTNSPRTRRMADNPKMSPPPPSSTSSNSNNNSIARVGEQTTISIKKMVHNLVSAMEVFPKKAHLAFVVDPTVPNEIVCNDLKVFRSSIALLTSACERTEQGFVRFHIYKKHVIGVGGGSGGDDDNSSAMLVFECEDTGCDVALEQYHALFQTPKQEQVNQMQGGEEECITVDPATGAIHRRSFCQVKKGPVSGGFAVYPVARYVESMGGEYGYLPRIARQQGSASPGVDSVPDTGSLFWFSIPLREVVSSLDAAIGTALGLDDSSEERAVVGSQKTDLRLSAQPGRQFF